jgi:hypothetical protein
VHCMAWYIMAQCVKLCKCVILAQRRAVTTRLVGWASRLSPPRLPKQAYGRDARATACTSRIFLSRSSMPTRVNDVMAAVQYGFECVGLGVGLGVGMVAA